MIIKRIIILINMFLIMGFGATFNFKLNKEKAYLNEPLIATFTLQFSKDENIIDFKPFEFNAKDIVAKNIEESNSTLKGNILQKRFKVILYPKRVGDIYIPQQRVKVATKDAKLQQISWKSIFSKESLISVKNIPKSTNIAGNLYLKAKVDKRVYSAKKPIKFTITIYGKGDLESLKPFKLNLKEQTLFAQEPKTTQSIKNGKIYNKYTQEFAIVADRNFTIPKITFSYFNTDTQMIEKLVTKPIKIAIKGTKNSDNRGKILYTIFGFLIGLIASSLIFLKRKKKIIKDISLERKILSSKSNKELYNRLMPYISRYNLDNLLREIELNIDSKKNLKSYKKEALEAITSKSHM